MVKMRFCRDCRIPNEMFSCFQYLSWACPFCWHLIGLVKKDLETSINAIARAELYTDTGW